MKQFLRDHPETLIVFAGGFVLAALEFYVNAILFRNAQHADLARAVSESLGG